MTTHFSPPTAALEWLSKTTIDVLSLVAIAPLYLLAARAYHVLPQESSIDR